MRDCRSDAHSSNILLQSIGSIVGAARFPRSHFHVLVMGMIRQVNNSTFLLEVLAQELPKLESGPNQTRLDCRQRYAESSGNRIHWQVLHILEKKYRSIDDEQRRDGLFENDVSFFE
jgi:hypothetical protein